MLLKRGHLSLQREVLQESLSCHHLIPWRKKNKYIYIYTHIKRHIYKHHQFNFKLLVQHPGNKRAVRTIACEKPLHSPMSTQSYLFMIRTVEEEQRKLHLRRFLREILSL